MNTVVYFVRHAETIVEKGIRNTDETDQMKNEKEILSIKGEKDSESLSKNSELKNIDIIWCSSYTRAKQTAKYIASKNDLQINIDYRLSERKLGNLDEIAVFMSDKKTRINSYLVKELRNVHIHSNDNRGNDHLPIYKNDIHWNEIMKGIIYLINNKYQYNIVYEYALECCYGETTKEKVIDYLNSIDFVSEKYN